MNSSDDDKGLLWKLLVVRARQLGNLGPAFGIAAGCLGLGTGLIGDIPWKLPVVRAKQLGKVGPAFGIGAGCGLGFGVGLIGGMGFSPGLPGLQLGFGFGAGCGVGLGFGYGIGRGVAYDDNQKHSNVGKLTQDEIGALIDEVAISTKKLIKATSKEIEKWRRP